MVLRTGETESTFSPGWPVYSSTPEGPAVAELGEIRAASVQFPESTLVGIIRNIPLAHKEPFLADSHPSIAKSRRDASRSEKAVHGELCINPK